MIVFIEGVLLSKESDKITINVNGIGYECNISGFTYDSLPQTGHEVSLHTYLNISENNHSLFGFLNIEEKNLFKMLIGINGVGPKTAMPILSSAKPNDIINRIDNPNISQLPFPRSSNSDFLNSADSAVDILETNRRLDKIHNIENTENTDKPIWQIHNKYLITEIN